MAYKTFIYPLLVREHHLDTLGHVNNATYLELFEEARWEIICQNNHGISGINKVNETGLGPVVLEIKIRYMREIFLREEVKIETQMISYVKKIGKLIQTLKRGDEVCCTAEITLAFFDMRERKLVKPTSDWLEAIGA